MVERALAALALGGNLGDPVAAFAFAFTRLDQMSAFEARQVSSVYRSTPWGFVDQPDFLNMAALGETRLSARALLESLLKVEAEFGRVRERRWGPRLIDLDLIDYRGVRADEPGLRLPHPRAVERAFVVVPLAEIAPDLQIGGQALRDLAARVDASGVWRDEEATARLKALRGPIE